ncbi:hypothetical protein E2C01_039831 [Portunus trituberculatus]|uniref:Uncharacterized protein n=1 Tax=Portunus trituberculatus TaxID=210409 RepID=A0A5B7FI05_PORTR|nr:hypothetical protein [Portunus trituberculatus]
METAEFGAQISKLFTMAANEQGTCSSSPQCQPSSRTARQVGAAEPPQGRDRDTPEGIITLLLSAAAPFSPSPFASKRDAL